MIKVSEMIAFAKAFAHLHRVTGIAMHPIHAGTLAGLLDACELELVELENAPRSTPSATVQAKAENIIHVKFTRPTPPEGGAA